MPHVSVLQPSLRNHMLPAWSLERGAGSRVPDCLRLGDRYVRLDDIARFDAYEDRSALRHGRFIAALLFAGLAGYTLLGVTTFGWQWRYMLAVAILSGLSLMALQDVYLSSPSRLYRFRVATHTGETICFAVADAASAAALLAVLRSL